MGNCINGQGAMAWVEDEDWDSEVSSRQYEEDEEAAGKVVVGEKKELLRVPSTEVKIKITKKQLDELLRKVDAKGMTIQQLLSDLMSMKSNKASLLERSHHWRPALQSIPELSDQ